MRVSSLLMEDHCQAFGLWKQLGVSGATCVHVDAHLDVMDRGFTPEVLEKAAGCQKVDDLANCMSPSYLPWGGIHCGNYLYPALKEGIVEHLVWVVPKVMVGKTPLLEFTRDELPTWVELTLEEFDSLHLDGPRVEGVLAGRRFTLCTSDRMPELEDRPVLLDIDVDYFQDSQDRIWQTPGELRSELGLKRVDALTVAFSVDGGYTGLENRYLGEVLESVFLDPDSPFEERTRAILEADQKRAEDPESYAGLPQDSDPDWLKAALLLKDGLARGQSVKEAAKAAQELDERYKVIDMNEALVHLRHGRHDRSLELLDQTSENNFVRAVVTFQCGRYEASADSWNTFLKTTELSGQERAYALFIRGQCLLQMDSLKAALADLEEAVKLDPDNYQYALFHGLVLQLNQDFKKAAKVWRKALSQHGERAASLGLHLELSRLYRTMGKTALANAELARVTQKDSAGQYKMVIQLEHLRSGRPPDAIPQTTLQGLWSAPMLTGGLR